MIGLIVMVRAALPHPTESAAVAVPAALTASAAVAAEAPEADVASLAADADVVASAAVAAEAAVVASAASIFVDASTAFLLFWPAQLGSKIYSTIDDQILYLPHLSLLLHFPRIKSFLRKALLLLKTAIFLMKSRFVRFPRSRVKLSMVEPSLITEITIVVCLLFSGISTQWRSLSEF